MAKQYADKTCCSKSSPRSAIYNMAWKIVLNVTLQILISMNRVNHVLQQLQRSKFIKIWMIFKLIKKILKITCDTIAAPFYAITSVIKLYFRVWLSFNLKRDQLSNFGHLLVSRCLGDIRISYKTIMYHYFSTFW